MLNYVLKRLLGLLPTLLIVAVLVFLFVHLLPGDPARLIAGPEADAQVIALVRQQLGLDRAASRPVLALHHPCFTRRFRYVNGFPSPGF
nr:ABC transporter permease [Salmonella sp. NCTC 7297]